MHVMLASAAMESIAQILFKIIMGALLALAMTDSKEMVLNVPILTCANDSNNCSSNGLCSNTFGGFECSCNAGFSGDKVECSDVDECSFDNCDVNANCTNLEGGFSCACKVGFRGDGENSE